MNEDGAAVPEVDLPPEAQEPPTTPAAAVILVPASAPDKPAGSAAPKPPPAALLRIAGRIPFTVGVVLLMLVLSIVFGTLWQGIEQKSWYDAAAFGLPAFENGHWYTLLIGCFFALHPVYYIFVAGLFLLLTGFAEWKLGTRRTIVITFGFQFAAVLLTALLLWMFRDTDWDWAQVRSLETDVGFSAGMLAALSAASAAVKPPWRLRLRLAIWVYVFFSFMFIGQLADAEHFLAVVLSMPFSMRLAGPRALRARALPTRHEVRLLAFFVVLVTAASQLVSVLLPDRLTPFTTDDSANDAWYLLALNLIITVLIANGLRHGYRWAWWIEVVLLGIPLALTVVVLVVVIIALFQPDPDLTFDDLGGFAANTVLSLALFVLLIAARRSFQVPRRGKRKLASGSSHPDTAKTLLRKWGGGTISWMTTWPENRHMITADGESYVAFRRHAGVAVALGDPIGPPEAAAAALRDFVSLCDRTGMIPYIFSCTDSTTAVTDTLGWQSVQVAEDNLIDLPRLEFKGKKWQDIRTALNKAPKEGITFQMVNLAEESWRMVGQVEHLSQEWLGDKKLPEMGFTLGGLSEALDPEVKVGLAIGPEGTVHGVTSWMPVYGEGGQILGWTLDLMRRADGGFKSTMEFLIASSCLYFKEQGARFLSLSGAPLARSGPSTGNETVIERFLDTLGASLEPVYGFRSLHQFKSKFQPRLSPMYMAFRDEGDLPRIGIAITRAYLPTASLGDMLAVVKH